MHVGLIDLHSHILPTLDDGPENLALSVCFAKAAIAQGIKTIVATPHYCKGYNVSILKRNNIARKLKKELEKQNIDLEIVLGFEVHVTKSWLTFSHPKRLTICGSKYILIEHAKEQSDWDEYVELIFSKKLLPIVAHPERFVRFRENFSLLEKIIERGGEIQLNTQSILGEHGEKSYSFCKKALQQNIATLISTDAHSHKGRAPKMQQAIKKMIEWVGESKTHDIIYTNPAKILGRKPNL